MIDNDRWQLPQGIEELLPVRAAALEALRVQLLGSMQARGYRLVSPPMIEFLESLLTGTGSAVERATYRVSDSETGRTMGVRADFTPQVARIDAHYLADSEVNRLCYAGPVVRTRPRTPGGAREELQLGGELFGIADLSADCEVIDTMLNLFDVVGAKDVTLSIGHVGIYRELVKLAKLDEQGKQQILATLQQFSIPDMDALIEREGEGESSNGDLSSFRNLMDLSGDVSLLDSARAVLPNTGEIAACLDQLAGVCEFVASAYPNSRIHIDLANVRGYQYHTGIIFECLVDGAGKALANGGRYDAIGADFGRSRPATGFSADLKALLSLQPEALNTAKAILAPSQQDAGLRSVVAQLRSSGEQVINRLSDSDAEHCDRQLVKLKNEWVVEPLER
jgi:ATP phosphoribosyltransferase regulatory subunit